MEEVEEDVEPAPELRLVSSPGPAPSLPHGLQATVENNAAKNNQPLRKAATKPGKNSSDSLKIRFSTTIRWLRNDSPTIKSNGSAKLKQTTNNGGTTTLSRTKTQHRWPDAEKSLGMSCEPLGQLKCWEIVNEASDLTRTLQQEIRDFLKEYSDEIHEGEGKRKPLSATIYMIGRSEATACPTIVISGAWNPRKRAMALVKRGTKLHTFSAEHDGLPVLLADSDRPPVSRVQRASANAAANLSLRAPSDLEVFSSRRTNLETVSAVQLYIRFSSEQHLHRESKATLGCLLTSGGKYFAWTAAHAFFDLPEFSDDGNSNSIQSDIEFAFDAEYGYESTDQESDASLTEIPQNDAQRQILPAITQSSDTGAESTAQTGNHFHGTGIDVQLEHFGSLFQSSFGPNDSSTDWALVEVTDARFKTATGISNINRAYRQVSLDPTPRQINVSLITSRGFFKGQLSSSPIFISIPPSPKFQELWVVRLDGGKPIEKGDCGALVVDSHGTIYGHLVSGDLERGIGHIVPAVQTFEEVKSQGHHDLALAEPPPKTPELPPLSPESNTLVGSLELRDGYISSESGPSLLRLDEVIDPEGENISHLPTVKVKGPAQLDDLETGLRRRPGAKSPPKRSGTPAMLERLQLPRRRKHFKRVHFWIDPVPVVPVHPAGFSNGYFIIVLANSRQSRSDEDNTNRTRILKYIDIHGFDFLIWSVAGVGIFGASYALSVTAVILPSLAFIYWPHETSALPATQIRSIILAGVFVGALSCGFLADRYGRRKVYGFGLSIILISILGIVQASAGFNNTTMSFLGWFSFWQFILGFGSGATYTTTAVLTSEFAPTASRSRMMAAVFLMQSMGQLIATVVALVVLVTYGKSHSLPEQGDHDKAASIADIMWRLIVGLGGLPILFGLLHSLTIPESFRYTLDISTEAKRKYRPIFQVTKDYYEEDLPPYSEDPEMVQEKALPGPLSHAISTDARSHQNPTQMTQMAASRFFQLPDNRIHDMDGESAHGNEQEEEGEGEENEEASPGPFSRKELNHYFLVDGNWRHLASVSAVSFFLHTAFTILGTNDYRVIAQIWASAPISSIATTLPAYSDGQSISPLPGAEIYNVLFNSAIRPLLIESPASVLGGLIAIAAVDFVPRRQTLAWSSLILAILFIVTGAVIPVSFQTGYHTVILTLYALCQLFFSIGPNALLFMIPAEIFPTHYRSTCYGIAFASGNLGSIIGGVIVTDKSLEIRSYFIISVSLFLIHAALISWAWLPDSQKRTSQALTKRDVLRPNRLFVNKTLETLAEGRSRDMESEEETAAGFRLRFLMLRKMIGRTLRNAYI